MTIKSFAHIHNLFLISSVRRSMFDAQSIYVVSVTHSLCVNGERCVHCSVCEQCSIQDSVGARHSLGILLIAYISSPAKRISSDQ